MSDTLPTMEGPVCPVPLTHNEQIVLGHGSGPDRENVFPGIR